MEWMQQALGPVQTNAYFLLNKERKALIVDPGDEAQKIIEWLSKKQAAPEAIILTHAHFDHIGAVDEVRKHYSIPVYVHEAEKKWLANPELNGSTFFQGIPEIKAGQADEFFSREGEQTIGSFTFQLLHTPGHSPGSVSLYFPEAELVIAGDALFMGSIGRTDLPGGDSALLLKSIHDKLLSLPEETYVLPGHGPVTTIGQEMDGNPFLNGF